MFRYDACGALDSDGSSVRWEFSLLVIHIDKSFGWLVIPRFGIVKKSQDGMYGFVWVLLGGVD